MGGRIEEWRKEAQTPLGKGGACWHSGPWSGLDAPSRFEGTREPRLLREMLKHLTALRLFSLFNKDDVLLLAQLAVPSALPFWPFKPLSSVLSSVK